jgi:hypothetical protein
MNLWMLLFLIIIVLFMVWFPVRLKRNSALYIGGFGLYFLTRTMAMLFYNFAPRSRDAVDHALLAASIGCLLVWLFALTPKGEEITTVVGHRWAPQEADHLIGQLDAINARLVRLSRR